MRLERRRILITGAGSGIGRALALQCAAKGARLVLAGRRSEPLAETRSLLPSPDAAVCVAADVGTAEGRAAVVAACSSDEGLDVVVNNAGMSANGPLESYDDDLLARLFATNVTGPIALTRDLLPLLRVSGWPHIVNVGSMFGDIAHPLFTAYSASKFALRGFSDGMRRELAHDGIGVTYVAPRATRTPATEEYAHLVDAFDMSMDSPEKVARQIVGAILENTNAVYPRGPERFFVLVQRLLPAAVDRALTRQLDRYLAAPVRREAATSATTR